MSVFQKLKTAQATVDAAKNVLIFYDRNGDALAEAYQDWDGTSIKMLRSGCISYETVNNLNKWLKALQPKKKRVKK